MAHYLRAASNKPALKRGSNKATGRAQSAPTMRNLHIRHVSVELHPSVSKRRSSSEYRAGNSAGARIRVESSFRSLGSGAGFLVLGSRIAGVSIAGSRDCGHKEPAGNLTFELLAHAAGCEPFEIDLGPFVTGASAGL
ncbi:hypothetical protein KM043_005720 [Ampulex compressa]|nr:hypothetical protein KM043_005720 [Ampulex compressa]